MRQLRWSGAVVLLVLSSLLVVASVAARFARSELLDTDRYVATVAPLASDPAVQAAVTTRLSAEIMQAADVPALTQQLATALGLKDPQAAASLAAPAITKWVTDQVTKVVNEVVTSPQFANLWTEANRVAHTQINNLLSGTEGKVISTQGADIVVDLGAILTAAKETLIARGWAFLSKIPDVSIPFTVAHVESLPEIQRSVSLLNKAATWLPILALALLALAVWCAPNHRRGLLIGLLVTLFLMIAALGVYAVLRNKYLDGVTARGLNVPAAETLWDTVLRYLVIAMNTVAATALLAAIWVFLSGPSRVARSFRRVVNAALDPLARLIGPRAGIRAFVTRWQPWLAVLLGVLALWWLFASPTVATALTIVVVMGLATAAVTMLRRLPE